MDNYESITDVFWTNVEREFKKRKLSYYYMNKYYGGFKNNMKKRANLQIESADRIAYALGVNTYDLFIPDWMRGDTK